MARYGDEKIVEVPVFRVNLYSLVNLYSKFKFNDSRMLLSADAYEYEQQAKPR